MLIDYAKNYHIKLGETTVVGYNQPSQPGLEAQMDIELMMTVAPNVHTYFWGIGTCLYVRDDDALSVTGSVRVVGDPSIQRIVDGCVDFGLGCRHERCHFHPGRVFAVVRPA